MIVCTLTLPFRDTALWRWAIVLIPGAWLYFFPLPGLNGPQTGAFRIFKFDFGAGYAHERNLGRPWI